MKYLHRQPCPLGLGLGLGIRHRHELVTSMAGVVPAPAFTAKSVSTHSWTVGPIQVHPVQCGTSSQKKSNSRHPNLQRRAPWGDALDLRIRSNIPGAHVPSPQIAQRPDFRAFRSPVSTSALDPFLPSMIASIKSASHEHIKVWLDLAIDASSLSVAFT